MTPIAERVLTTDDGRTVTVEIYAPERDPDPTGDWRCQFRISGAVEADAYGHGLDSLSALLNAIPGVRRYLDDSGLSLTWVGDEPGDHGVPRVVPQFLGRAFAKDIEDEIDQRIAAIRPPGAP
jgi:hypothetical protein